MDKILIIIFVLIVAKIIHLGIKRGKEEGEIPYTYRRKPYIMTRKENTFYHTLSRILGNQYYIFPQVNLITLFEYKIKGQNWKGAKATIDRLSVDYVICDNRWLSPILAVELDDPTHQRGDRIVRDRNVEKIFRDAKIPLVRIAEKDSINEEYVRAEISKYL